MKTRSFAVSDTGLKRKQNEDTYVVDEELGLFLVCDGMGGHAAGDIASSTAAEKVIEHLRYHQQVIRDAGRKPAGYFRLTQLLSDAVNYACQVIYGQASTNSELAGMGTTLTMLLFVDDKAIMAHVGDSRLYLYRKGEMHHLSLDHTLVNQMAADPNAETIDENLKHILTRAVGVQPGVLVDTLMFDLQPADRCLLCTDGLSNYFRDNAHAAGFVAESETADITGSLLNHALSCGGTDNITAILIEVEAHEASEDAAEAEGHLELLGQVPLFNRLSLARQLALTEIADIREFIAGEFVLQREQNCDGLHLVIEGQLRRNGSAILSRGSVFGEASLVCLKKSPDDLVASEDSRVLVIPREEFDRLLVRRPKLGRRLLKRLVTHFARSESI